MMHVYIPSRKRIPTLFERTLAQIPEAYRPRTSVVVTEEDAKPYADALARKYPEVKLMVAPKGIAATRQAIGHDARDMGHETFCMMDDDLKFFKRKAADDFHLVATDNFDRTFMLQTMEEVLDKYAHAAFSSREGNNRYGVGAPPFIQESTRALRTLAFRTQEFNACEHGRVDVMEDFDIQLQLLEKGLPNAVLAYWAHDQQMTNAAGGCSLYRTQQVHERSARKLADLHPGFVKLRQKQNKTDKDGFGSRTEVTVYWKKALGANK